MTQTLTTDRFNNSTISELFERCTDFDDMSLSMDASEFAALKSKIAELSVLANREAQPVMYASELTLAHAKESERSLIAWSEPMHGASIPLYTAPPAPAVPDEMTFSEAENFIKELTPPTEEEAAMFAWNAGRAAMLKAESKPCNRCHGEEWVIDEMGITPCVCRRDGNATLTNEGTIAQPQNEPQIIPNNIPDGCEWIYDAQDCKWDSGCGDAWMFCDGGPAENGVKFCQCCGKPIVLAAAPEGGNG